MITSSPQGQVFHQDQTRLASFLNERLLEGNGHLLVLETRLLGRRSLEHIEAERSPQTRSRKCLMEEWALVAVKCYVSAHIATQFTRPHFHSFTIFIPFTAKVLRQPDDEVILVDDDTEEAQRTRASKYLFSADSQRKGKQTVHPSGTNTAYLDKFKDAAPLPVDLTGDSDEIESFSDSPIPPSDPRLQGRRSDTGPNVKALVANIEAKTGPPQESAKSPRWVDLTTVPLRGKNRMQKRVSYHHVPPTNMVLLYV